MKSIPSTIDWVGPALSFLLICAMQLISCGKKEQEERPATTTETTEQHATLDQVSITITKIDENAIQPGKTIEVGRQVIVGGMISDNKANILD
jgi:hypothetical protein